MHDLVIADQEVCAVAKNPWNLHPKIIQQLRQQHFFLTKTNQLAISILSTSEGVLFHAGKYYPFKVKLRPCFDLNMFIYNSRLHRTSGEYRSHVM